MSIRDMFRQFFGFPEHSFHQDEWPPENNIRPPDQEGDVPSLFNEPEEMFRHFERHFEDIFRSFGFMEFSLPPIPFESEPMPGIQFPDDVPLRDKLLKQPDSNYDRGADLNPSDSTPKAPMFRRFFGPKKWDDPHTNQRQDQDLDTAVSSQGLDALLRDSPTPAPNQNKSRFSSFSSSSVIIKGADGKVEKRISKRDSQGNEETSVVRQFGDKVHTFTTRRHKDGVQEHEENFVNMDEGNKEVFEREWNSKETGQMHQRNVNPFNSQDPSASEIFKRLFKSIMP